MPTTTRTTTRTDDARAQAPRVAAARSQAMYFESTLDLLPGVTIPLRAMLIDSIASRLLISPVGTAEETTYAGRNLHAVIAPSLLHHKHLAHAIEHYRPAVMWAPPGFAEKKPELASLAPLKTFGVDPWPYADDVDALVVEGAPKRNEVVFFHKASKTLYTADLVFNITQPEGFLTPVTFRLMGIYKRFAVAKMWKKWVVDKPAFQHSIERILGWDFEQIAMAHGELVERDGRACLERALREVGLLD